MSFFISLTGLNAAQTELTALSNNIANVGTSGFKKSRVEFGDIVTRSATQASNSVNGAGVAVSAVKQQFGQGGYQTSSNALDLSIGGQGFFVVRGGGDNPDSMLLSRNGAFSVNADQWVVDNEGRRLQVYPTTPDGAVTGLGTTSLMPLRIPTTSGDPAATTEIRFTSNLPTSAVPPTLPFSRDNPATYNGAVSETVYDAAGNASTNTVYYRAVDDPAAAPNKTWEVHAFLGDAAITPLLGPGPEELTFDPNGVLLSPATPTTYSGGFAISHADTAITNQPFSNVAIVQDGYAPGRLEGVGVDLTGTVRASFSNGQTIAIGKLALANVANPQGLRQEGNASWGLSPSSGPLQLGMGAEAGFGSIKSGSIERSNVDLTEELVGLISAQRNFQANARAIDTASQLLQTIIQLRN